MVKITLQDKHYHLPQGWHEVPKASIPTLLTILSGNTTGDTYRTILRVLLDIPEKEWNKFIVYHFDQKKVSDSVIEENAIALQNLINIVSWLWRTPLNVKPIEHIKLRHTTSTKLFKRSFSKITKCLLPPADLKYLSWGELLDALIHYELYTTQAVEGNTHLDLLLATICRPERPKYELSEPNWSGDPRIQYNSFHSELTAKYFESIPADTKFTVLIYFGGIVSDLFKRFDLSSGSSDTTEEYSGQNLLKNTFNLAEKHVFGNYDQTRQKNCYEVLTFLEENKKDMAAQAAEYEKLNK